MSIAAAVIALGLGGSPAMLPDAAPAPPRRPLVLAQGRPDAPGYGVSPPGYGDPQRNGATPDGYGSAPGFGDRPAGNGVPPAGYGALPPGAGQGLGEYGKATGYGVQPQGYGQPPPSSSVSPGYGAPPTGYGQAPPSYGHAPGYGQVPREPLTAGGAAGPSWAGQTGGIAVPPAIPGVHYRYDEAGRFIGATETIDNTTRVYDEKGRVTRTFVRTGSQVVVFDANGHAIQRSGGQ
jgi:hypothetical protein